jgi:hypothetical protein
VEYHDHCAAQEEERADSREMAVRQTVRSDHEHIALQHVDSGLGLLPDFSALDKGVSSLDLCPASSVFAVMFKLDLKESMKSPNSTLLWGRRQMDL